MIQKELKKYIETEIHPLYERNDWAHQIWHIYEVIRRSIKLAKNCDVDINMVYTIASFHDIACFQGRENHEKNSAKILLETKGLHRFFTEEQIMIMKEAIEDLRGSSKTPPRSIYGKIVATADRYTNMKLLLRSTESFCIEFKKEETWEQWYNRNYNYIKEKYGPTGYAKVYIKDEEYEKFLEEVKYYLDHPIEFEKLLISVDKFIRKDKNLPSINYQKDKKRYLALDTFYKKKFHQKISKISLNGGFACPNYQNGHGCIFCSHQSGDFAGDKRKDLETQFNDIKKRMKQKWPNSKYIGYFQAGTNTYAPMKVLKEKFETVLKLPDVVGLSIATRSDAISDDILDYLEELNQKTFLTIELGLQSIHEKSLTLINRGHTLENFEQMVKKLQARNVFVVAHIINGLPNETKEDMLKTVKYLNNLKINGIKIHMLHILKDTPLESFYEKNPFPILTKDEYIEIVCDQLELLNPNIVIQRLTGDAKKEDLIEPFWTLKKFEILNDIDRELEKRNSYQGKYI